MKKIYGIGIDIINIIRIKKILKKNKKFKERIFSKKEISYCEKKKDQAACYAKRYAAKEAFSKSLGTGIGNFLNFNEIEVNKTNLKKPYILLKGKALKSVNKITNKSNYKIYLSLSDDIPFAIAIVILVIL
tara:strand:+ start:2496 stop:2888 length:393 start_codon:yes stop_codon:yes gene_type:complete